MRIAQLSDIHVLDPRFEARLLDAAIEEINAEDLTWSWSQVT